MRPLRAERAAELLGADEVLVAFLHLPLADAPLVEPRAIRRAEILDEVVAALAGDRRVLAADLARVDDQVAVLAAADEEALLGDAIELAAVGGDDEDAPA